jgi:hypothetical protein
MWPEKFALAFSRFLSRPDLGAAGKRPSAGAAGGRFLAFASNYPHMAVGIRITARRGDCRLFVVSSLTDY